MFPQQLGWSYTSPSYFRNRWIVSLGNVKNSFRVSLPSNIKENVWWFLLGSLARHGCCSVHAVVSAQWWKKKTGFLPVVNRNSTGLEFQPHVPHGTDLLIESPVCETQTGTASRAGEWRPCGSSGLTVLTSSISFLFGSCAGQVLCLGTRLPRLLWKQSQTRCRSKSSPSPLITHKVNPSPAQDCK